jgi:Kef-type K+ transport system membrane component KefB
MHGDVFIELSVVLVIAAIVATIMRLFRQPMIMGYIITGIVVGPGLLNLVSNRQAFDTFSDIGIALLLFIIGLELNVTMIRKLGKTVALTALAILTLIGSIGCTLGLAFGLSATESLLAGVAMFFSSTIIIAKVLSDKKQISRLHGRLAIGIVLLDDVVATIVLLIIGAGQSGSLGASDFAWLLLKGLVMGGVLTLIGMKVLPRVSKFMASSQELLFLFAISWGFGIATLVSKTGFSIEVGALFAGVALAHLPYAPEIGARLKPLRDFFIILFFIVLGEGLVLKDFSTVIWPALAFSLAVIILKPLVVMGALGAAHYTKFTSFKVAINLSQISEFSIIVAVLAAKAGFVGQQFAAIITLVAIITIAVSTYLMQYDDWLYSKFERHLRLFERSEINEHQHKAKAYPLVLFGYKRGGHEFVKTFRDMKQKFVVVDYDPEVIETLQRRRVEYLYGDAADHELLDELDMEKVKIVISTIGDYETNAALASYVTQRNPEGIFICHADGYEAAAKLYEHGAAYVMLPRLVGNERISAFIRKNYNNRHAFDSYRKRHILFIGKTALA